MAGPPSGTVTFLFTDIEGSTALWERDPVAMRTAVARHFVLLQNAITAHGGVLFKTVGDAVHAAFRSAAGAVAAAVDAQQELHAEPWALPEPLRVRMALHTGEVTPVDDDYAAPVLNRLSRLLAVGHGGQVLLAATTEQLVRGTLPPGTALHDHGEHRLRDLQPEHIFHLIGAELPTDFPPLRTLEHHPNNLSTPLTTFIGREQEVAAVQTLLTDDAVRLLTLTGPGGVGKTRLAVRAAAGLLETFPDGISFVNLATLGDPRLVLPTIARVLGVREEGSLPLRDRLAAHLQDRRLLFILDNFEQLLEVAPLVSELLIEAPGLTVLVTSRSRLRLQGEREVTVPPLAAPAPDVRTVTVDSVAEYAAVRLFVDRARAARPDFTLTSENAAVVAAICARLDGLPLALELAAARVKLLRLPALLNRLERRLPLLTGGARDLPARQQTLRATIAWSYDLLTPDEQAVLRRLAVFVGGWTIEAAEAVVIPAGDLGLDVLEGIGALLDASLVQPVDESGDDPRFRMLETVREFGLERLIERGEEHAIRERHAAWFLDRAEHEWGVDVWGVGEIPALQQAEAEYPNLRAALAWLLDQRPEDALRLASNLTLFWWVQGQVPEASDWLHRALTKGTAAAADVRASALGAAARLAFAQGRAEEGVKLSEESLALWDSLGADANSSPHYAVALFERGGSAYWAGNMEEAEHYFLRAQERFAALGMVMWQAATSAVYGGLTFDRGDLNRSEELHREALTVAQAEHNPVVTAFALSGLADVALARGDAQKAGSLWHQSLNLSWRLREMLLTPDKFVGLADVAAHQGNAALAAQLLGADQAQREASGLALSGRRAWFDHACAVAQASLGADGFQQAWDEGRTWSLERAVTEAQATTTSAMPSASTDPPRSPV